MSGLANILDFNRQGLAAWFAEHGHNGYRADQVFKWIHYYGVGDFTQMTNLSKKLREQLAEHFCFELPEVIMDKESKDGTRKWLMRLAGGNSIETVYIPEANRGTLCVSSQVGCALNCRFCSTGAQGFNRDLTTAEIIAQVWLAVRALSKQEGEHDRAVTNVVMMGMGEPLLNFESVVSAMDIMMDDFAYSLAKRRVTLSTSGVVPAMYELAKRSDVALAVSLHAPNDELRNVLVPINKKYPIKTLMAACKDFFKDEPKRKITFEYVMLKGVNDKAEHAKQLIKILANVPNKVNLIPFNPFPGTQYECSDWDTIVSFKETLKRAGLNTTVRSTRGDDIDAACGQLVGAFKDRTFRRIRIEKANRENSAT